MSYSSEMERSIERSQRIMEYGLGVAVPSMLSLMMFTYVLLPVLFPVFMGLGVLAAVSMLIPAKRIHDLSYRCWAKDTLPRTIVTSMLGIIYITEVSVFAVSMLSFYEGLDPERPLTFAVFASLVMGLIVVLAYNDRNKERFERTHKRMVKMGSEATRKKVTELLTMSGHEFTERAAGRKNVLDLKAHGLVIDMKPLSAGTTELFLTVEKDGDREKAEGLRTALSFD